MNNATRLALSVVRNHWPNCAATIEVEIVYLEQQNTELFEALRGIMHYANTGAAACDVYTDEQPEFVRANAILAEAGHA